MKYYTPSTPRFALGFAAVAMMVITLAVSVILPMQTKSANGEPPMLAAATSTQPMDVATIAGIRVVAAREPAFSTIAARVGEAGPQSGRPGKAHSPVAAPISN